MRRARATPWTATAPSPAPTTAPPPPPFWSPSPRSSRSSRPPWASTSSSPTATTYGPGARDLYRGTAHYLSTLPAGAKPKYAIVLDLVGERRARFPREAASRTAAPELVDRVWGIAGQMGLDTVFVADTVAAVPDQRVRMLRAAGIPAVLVTDPEYGPGNRFSHSIDDGVPLLDRETLGQVGEVVAEVVYRGIPQAKGK